MVVGDPLEETFASRSAAILAGDVQIGANLVNIDEVIHITSVMRDILSPLLSGLNALGVFVSFWLGLHQLECVGDELIGGPIHSKL